SQPSSLKKFYQLARGVRGSTPEPGVGRSSVPSKVPSVPHSGHIALGGETSDKSRSMNACHCIPPLDQPAEPESGPRGKTAQAKLTHKVETWPQEDSFAEVSFRPGPIPDSTFS